MLLMLTLHRLFVLQGLVHVQKQVPWSHPLSYRCLLLDSHPISSNYLCGTKTELKSGTRYLLCKTLQTNGLSVCKLIIRTTNSLPLTSHKRGEKSEKLLWLCSDSKTQPIYNIYSTLLHVIKTLCLHQSKTKYVLGKRLLRVFQAI